MLCMVPAIDATQIQKLNCTAVAAMPHVTSVWCIRPASSTSASSDDTLVVDVVVSTSCASDQMPQT